MSLRSMTLIAALVMSVATIIECCIYFWQQRPVGTTEVTGTQQNQLASEMEKAATASPGKIDLRGDDDSASYCIGLETGRYLIEAKRHHIHVNADAVVAGMTDGAADQSLFTDNQVSTITNATDKRMEGDPTPLSAVASDDEACYCIGLGTGRRIKGARKYQIELNLDAVTLGIKDGLESKRRFTAEGVKYVEAAFKRRLEDAQADEAEAAASQKNLKDGLDFLEKNKTQPGVHVTASGLQYLVLHQGAGPRSPTMADMVKVTYRGTLIDGSVFSTSEKLGGSVTFTLNYVVPGWVEALEMMKEGDKWRLFIPPNLGYGDKSPIPEIPANSTLIIDVELVQITPR